MAQTVKLKRSSTTGKVPTTSNLALGELAINTNDGKIFFEKNDGSDSIQSILTTNTPTPITGSLQMSGSSSYVIGVTGSINTKTGRVYEQGTSVVDTAIAFSIVFGS
jgi:ribosomal protein S4E